MENSKKIPLTSSEIANLWITYQDKTMFMIFLDHFMEHEEDEQAHQLLMSSYQASSQAVETIKEVLRQEGAVIPIGFTEEDLNKGTPKLFDYYYSLFFLHLLSKIGTALFSLFTTMSYRKDIKTFYIQQTEISQNEYDKVTELLLEKGILPRPPYITIPKKVTFVKDKSYLSGFNILHNTRPLNAIELSLLYNAIDTNLVGLQLMLGFAQVAKNKQAKEYFIKGTNLAMKVETTLGKFLREDYIEPPATHAGKATTSTIAPFSDKVMMYITSLLSTFGLGSNALGGAFCLRSDLPATMALLGKDIYSFAKEGGEIMISNGWMEEPPGVENRKKLENN